MQFNAVVLRSRSFIEMCTISRWPSRSNKLKVNRSLVDCSRPRTLHLLAISYTVDVVCGE